MKFILLTDSYYPLVGSGSIIVGDLVNEFINQGHEVLVITFVDSQSKSFIVTKKGKLTILRIRMRIRKYGKIGRLIAESMYSKEIIKNLNNVQETLYDGVICYSPSIFFGKAISYLKNRFNVKAYLIVRDIFPKWILDAGLIKDGLVFRYLKKIESFLYNSPDVIGIESKSDLDYFKKYGIQPSIKIEVLNNWASHSEYFATVDQNKLIDSKKINIIYGGNMGAAQDLLSLVNLIDISVLKNRAVIYLIGDGDQYVNIEKIINRKKLSNIILMPSMKRSKFLPILANADIGLVSLNEKLISNNYPLKMIGYMQLSIPILASVNEDNEIIGLINDNNIGCVSLANDKNSFNKNLDEMISNNFARKAQGDNAKLLFNKNYTVKAALSQIFGHFK
jgi:O26-antigen biosynthesis N-acetyl-L-fucosamine transferase